MISIFVCRLDVQIRHLQPPSEAQRKLGGLLPFPALERVSDRRKGGRGQNLHTTSYYLEEED